MQMCARTGVLRCNPAAWCSEQQLLPTCHLCTVLMTHGVLQHAATHLRRWPMTQVCMPGELGPREELLPGWPSPPRPAG